MKIGERLKEKRMEASLSQKELGEILHVSRQTVSSWEVGRTYPDLETLVTISEYYDVPLDELLKEDSNMVEEISKKVKKSERRKAFNIILTALLIIVIIFSAFYFLNTRHLARTNEEGLSPNDLIESSWELNHSTERAFSQVFLSFDRDSIARYQSMDPNMPVRSDMDEDQLRFGAEELLEQGIEDGTVEFSNLDIELDKHYYIVNANGYSNRFEKLSDTIIRDLDGNEYRRIASESTHDSLHWMDEVMKEQVEAE